MQPGSRLEITAGDPRRMMGVYAHSIQDARAHHGGNLGHPRMDIRDPQTGKVHEASIGTTHADVPYLRPGPAMNALQETYNKLLEFSNSKKGEKFAGKTRMAWNDPDFQAALSGFIGAREVRDKNTYYNRLCGLLQKPDPELKITRGYLYAMPEIWVIESLHKSIGKLQRIQEDLQ